jgi:hypothetical protein
MWVDLNTIFPKFFYYLNVSNHNYKLFVLPIYIKTEDPPEANTNTYINMQCGKITVDQSKTIIDHSIKWYTACPDNPNHS